MWSWFLARLKGIFNWIASIIIFFVLLAVVGGVIGMFTQPKLPGEMVLTLDMRDGLPDQASATIRSPVTAPRRLDHRRRDRARQGRDRRQGEGPLHARRRRRHLLQLRRRNFAPR